MKKFTELLESYKNDGIKSLPKMFQVSEEADEDCFNKEVEDTKKKAEGKIKNKAIAAPAVQGVQVMPKVKTEELVHPEGEIYIESDDDSDDQENIEERTLSPEETNKKEDIVKSMKKNTSYFKNKYGDRWKDVMYGAATNKAKE